MARNMRNTDISLSDLEDLVMAVKKVERKYGSVKWHVCDKYKSDVFDLAFDASLCLCGTIEDDDDIEDINNHYSDIKYTFNPLFIKANSFEYGAASGTFVRNDSCGFDVYVGIL